MRLLPILFSLSLVACAGPQAEVRRAEDVVWRALGDRSAAVRVKATRVVVELADPLLDRGLPARLVDEDATVRALAAGALSAQAPQARPVLVAALEDRAAPAARLIALDAIGALPDAAERLVQLAGDADAGVREHVAAQLATLRPTGAHALLVRLTEDGTPAVRAGALRALAAWGEQSDRALVERGFADPALAVRLAALAWLARMGADSDRLVALAGGGDAYLALRAAVALAHLGRSALDAVTAAARDRQLPVRAAALNAAGELGAPGAVIAAEHLDDPSLEVQLAAARALIAATDGPAPARAVAVLHAALAGPLGTEAAIDLAQLGDARGRAVLDEQARAPNPLVRRRAIDAWALLTPAPPLVRALDDTDAQVRLAAARAILKRAR